MTEEDADFRLDRDSLGELEVPIDALWGAQTQRAIENFPISYLGMPRAFLRALGLIKASAARANDGLYAFDQYSEDGLGSGFADAIATAALEVAMGEHDASFPVDVFQTGSGTSTNMNANEVIAKLASKYSGLNIHPNDHVNKSQSSNDVIPSSIQVAAALLIDEELLPAMRRLVTTLDNKAASLSDVVKTGRTHLMDAMPIRFDQELGAWSGQIKMNSKRLQECLKRLLVIPQGGTAVGTGINAENGFGKGVAHHLCRFTDLDFSASENPFVGISSQDLSVECSGHLKTLAVSLMKIANDLRWMNSGPNAGLGEIQLPELQPGSSIMPGKVNPVIPEAVAMVAAQVIGNDATITVAGQSGNFQLNVMLPVIAHNLLQSIEILANATNLLESKCIAGFEVNEARIKESLSKNPILITALNDRIGYDLGGKLAKQAYREQKPLIDIVEAETDIPRDELERILNPEKLTGTN